jgi:hypothetical protein
MDRLFDALRPLIRGVVRHAAWVLVAAVLLAGAGLYYASQLTIDTDIANLVPEDRPSVQALEELRRTVGGESDVAVGIVSPSFEANKRFAEALIPRALDLTNPETGAPFLTRVEYEREVDFLKDNALYFASESELTSVEQFLDEKVEEAKLEANPFYFNLDDEESNAEADSAARELEQVYDRLVGKRYPVSDDSTTMVVRFYPSGTSTDIGFIDRLYDRLRETVDEMDPASYNADMEVVLSGRLYRRLVEVRTIQGDVAGSFGTGAGSVLLVVVLYFLYKAARARGGRRGTLKALVAEAKRAPVMAGVIAIPLVMSLMWTGGVAYGLYENLNLMTSTLGLVLFGLGIDFGIHFYGRYAEERADGRSVEAAAETTFTSTGQAITIGALTTAGALFVLTAAEFKGFSEFGAIAGTGVLFALLAMTVVMTALLAVLERTRLLNLQAAPASGRVGEADDASAGRRYPAARPLVVGSLFAVGAALVLLPEVGFQYRFGELEPEYEEYEEKARVIDRYSTGESGRRNPAYIVADSAADVPEIVRAVEAKQADSASTVLAVESLQERFPLRDSSRAEKLARIAEIRDRLATDKYLRNADSEQIDRLRRAAQTREPIALEQVPESLRKRFTTRDGELGTFVVIYPSVGLSDGRNSIAFKKEIGTVRTEDGETYHAGSTSLVAAEMLLIMQEEAPWMVAGTLLLVALLMLLNFRSWRWAGLALVPLVVGILWMLLVMELFGLMLNFYNMIVLPAVVGIGNDAGVHLVHRYREEGRGSIREVLRSTGEHVTMGSLTTMIGFGGLLLSFHPGLRSIGVLAVVGIGATLVSALVFLPALLQWLEDRGKTPLPDAPPATDATGGGAGAPSGNGALPAEEEAGVS